MRIRAGITWRGILLGIVGVVLMCAVTPFNEYTVNNTPLVGAYFPIAVSLYFFLIVVGINSFLHRFAPERAIRQSELAVAMLMMLVVCCIPTQGMLRQLLPTMVSPFWLGARDSNFWNNFYNLKLPEWLFPVKSMAEGRSDPVVGQFYERLEEGQVIPYSAWIKPVAAWSVLVGGLVMSMVALAWIVREQWAVNERLPFPLVQLELAMIEPPAAGKAINPLFRSKLFWFGLAIAFIFQSLAALRLYYPQYFPDIPRRYNLTKVLSEEPWVNLPNEIKQASIYFTFIGITYFIQTRVAFSLWFCWVFIQVMNMYLKPYQADIPAGALGDQHLGAAMVYVVGVFWIGKKHWGKVLRHAFSGLSEDEKRRNESCFRVPFFMLLAGVAIMIGWLLVVGMTWWMTLIVVGFALLAHFVTTRVVAETGLPIFRATMQSPQVIYGIDPNLMTGKDVWLMGATNINIGAFSASQSSFAFALHGLRVADQSGVMSTRQQRWSIAGCIVGALVIGFVICVLASLRNEYSYAMSLEKNPTRVNTYAVDNLQQEQFVAPLARHTERRWPPQSWSSTLHVSSGAIIAGVLQICAWQFSWWPILPVGYIVSTGTYMGWVWWSVFLGWLLKVLIVRFGGAKMFIEARPVFVGLILGETLAAGFWLLLNLYLAWGGHENFPVKFLPN